jgi:hypothetical protein
MTKDKNCKFLIIISIILFQGCYFGIGLVEQNLTDNFSLFANNSLDELSIWYKTDKHIASIIVKETVFAVGYNNDFIIAKSHPKDSNNEVLKELTYYHIIEISKISKSNPQISPRLPKEQYVSMRKQLNIPNDLDFEIVFEEIE